MKLGLCSVVRLEETEAIDKSPYAENYQETAENLSVDYPAAIWGWSRISHQHGLPEEILLLLDRIIVAVTNNCGIWRHESGRGYFEPLGFCCCAAAEMWACLVSVDISRSIPWRRDGRSTNQFNAILH